MTIPDFLFPRLLMSILVCCSLNITGCAIKERTQPLPPVFLDGAPLESTIKEVPFKHAWIAKSGKPLKLTSVYIKPIRTDLLPTTEWEKSKSVAIRSQDEFNKSTALLARYFRIKLLSDLKAIKDPRFQIVDVPSPASLVVEIAFTELVLSEPVIRAAALAAPVPGVDFALSAFSDPHLAFAARFTNSDGSRLLATAADRRFPPVRIIDLNKLRATSSAREIISQWSRELAESIQFEELTKVSSSWGFSLLPW